MRLIKKKFKKKYLKNAEVCINTTPVFIQIREPNPQIGHVIVSPPHPPCYWRLSHNTRACMRFFFEAKTKG